jgi:hypothetical protein
MMPITVYRDLDVLPDPATTRGRGLDPVARVDTDDLEVAWLLTENEPLLHKEAEQRAGCLVGVQRYRPSRSNVVGDIFVRHTPDGDVPYRVASAGFVRLTPEQWSARNSACG